MGQLRIVTWNAEGMFAPEKTKVARTRRANEHDAIKTIKQLDADVLMIPEFGEYGALDQTIQTTINSLGYEIIETPYEQENEPAPFAMAILSRLPVLSREVHRFGGFRNASQVIVANGDDKIRIIGVHLDDKSEETRLHQAQDLISLIESDKKLPMFVLGDFNAMNRKSLLAKVFNTSMFRVPIRQIRHARVRSISDRLHGMAAGTTITQIEELTSLRNLDPGHHLTISGKQAGLEWMPAIRLAKIDWIFGSRHFKVVRYKVYRDVGSDHRPVIADVSF